MRIRIEGYDLPPSRAPTSASASSGSRLSSSWPPPTRTPSPGTSRRPFHRDAGRGDRPARPVRARPPWGPLPLPVVGHGRGGGTVTMFRRAKLMLSAVDDRHHRGRRVRPVARSSGGSASQARTGHRSAQPYVLRPSRGPSAEPTPVRQSRPDERSPPPAAPTARMTGMDPRAGTLAQPADLVDLSALVTAYYTEHPDPSGRRAAGGVRHLGPPRVGAVASRSTTTTSPRRRRRSASTAPRRASTGRCSSARTPTPCPSRPRPPRSRCSRPTT